MPFDPIAACGAVLRRDGEGVHFLGSCAAIREDHVALTAAHVVAEVETSRLAMHFPRMTREYPIANVVVHPDADVALLLADRPSDTPTEGYPEFAFWNSVSNLSLGEEFMAYGYPVEGPSSPTEPLGPIARLFRGHYQRYFEFRSARYRYVAGELSIPAPRGLSGGPLFRPGAPQMLTAIATANLDSAMAVEGFDEAKRVISYGLAALLFPLEPWLDDHVPHRPGTAWNPTG